MSESLEEFYTNLLDIRDPWKVASIKRASKSKKVTVIVAMKAENPLVWSICGMVAKLHDRGTGNIFSTGSVAVA